MDYELYHDESKKLGYWHGILMVPVHTKSTLLEYLSVTRDNTTYSYPLSIKRIRKNRGKKYDCAESWVQLGVVSLVSQRKGPPEGLFLGRDYWLQVHPVSGEGRSYEDDWTSRLRQQGRDHVQDGAEGWAALPGQ